MGQRAVMNLRPSKLRSRSTRRVAGVAGVAAVALSLGSIGVVQASSATTAAVRSSRLAVDRHTRRRPVPAWAEKCLPQGSERAGPASGYVGLSLAAARRRDHYRNDLVFAGGGGRCSHFDDDVFRAHPIALVFNTQRSRTSRARIIAAARATAGWQPGKRHS
jgi:hypothetical protein